MLKTMLKMHCKSKQLLKMMCTATINSDRFMLAVSLRDAWECLLCDEVHKTGVKRRSAELQFRGRYVADNVVVMATRLLMGSSLIERETSRIENIRHIFAWLQKHHLKRIVQNSTLISERTNAQGNILWKWLQWGKGNLKCGRNQGCVKIILSKMILNFAVLNETDNKR